MTRVCALPIDCSMEQFHWYVNGSLRFAGKAMIGANGGFVVIGGGAPSLRLKGNGTSKKPFAAENGKNEPENTFPSGPLPISCMIPAPTFRIVSESEELRIA